MQCWMQHAQDSSSNISERFTLIHNILLMNSSHSIQCYNHDCDSLLFLTNAGILLGFVHTVFSDVFLSAHKREDCT